MRIRRLASLFIFIALIARLASPCEALASRSVDAPNAPIAKCHLLANTSPAAQSDSDQAPLDNADRDGCSCALCQLGWSPLPPADAVFTIPGVEYNLAPRAPSARALVLLRPNRGAPTRGPPSFT
ncbi:hypothetical protein [Methylocystis hirsuta]|uniref:DUF2946 domain-containing protein n=1 Tax=Methylocystis hirsuta TaxID=369798 RepID=A0A3M9XVV9_9HYPH|nr:hypothetical protein [Methylocystis hirsuta]RNJ51050.1 hypothetical protein D1O30_17070 [Methylocystis hirsuta]